MSWGSLRAKYVSVHGERKTARAESLAMMQLAMCVLEHATERRRKAELAFLGERIEAEEMPPGWRDENPNRVWVGAWLPKTWRALERVAEASRVEVEWALRVGELAMSAAVDADDLRAEVVHATHRWGW